MSLIVDLDNEPGNVNQLKKDLTEAITANQPAPKKEPTKADPEPDLPEKYRGKSVTDIIEMHRNAESELGRRGNELGQYKQLTDRLLELKRSEDLRKGGGDEIEEDDFPKISSRDLLDDPTGAVAKVVEARLTAAERKRQQKEAESELGRVRAYFEEKHPDATEIVNSSEFGAWVKERPSRLHLAQQAAQADWSAGDILLDEYKAERTVKATEDDDAPKAGRAESNLEAAKRAGTMSAGQSQVTDKPSGKVYRRLDLIRLKLEDPEAYGDPGFQQEILRAYAEGRVK